MLLKQRSSGRKSAHSWRRIAFQCIGQTCTATFVQFGFGLRSRGLRLRWRLAHGSEEVSRNRGDDRASLIEHFGAGSSGVVFKTSGLTVIKKALAKVLSSRRVILDRGRPRHRPSTTPQQIAGRTHIDLRKVRRRLLLQGRRED